mgnify:CR=1 FL=1
MLYQVGVFVLRIGADDRFFFLVGVAEHVGSKKIKKAVVVKISKFSAHGLLGAMLEVLCYFVRKGSIPVVDIQLIGLYKVISDIYIRPSIPVKVFNGDTKSIHSFPTRRSSDLKSVV